METRSMRRNKYTMEQIDRLEQSNQELLEKKPDTSGNQFGSFPYDYLLSLNRRIFQHKFIHSQIHLPLRKKRSYAVL